MSDNPSTNRIEESVAKVDGEVAVGEDLEFQRKWWRFERGVWIFFTIIILLALAGAFGRGPLAKAERTAADGTLNIRYDRIQRSGAPSIVTVNFLDAALQSKDELHLYVSESLVKELGTQRVAPAPLTTVTGNGGLTYTFPVSKAPASVEFELEPLSLGLRHFIVRAVGHDEIDASVLVLP